MLEFRVRWQRVGRRPKTVIYQDWSAACRKMRAVQALDAVKGEFERYEDMPSLAGPPVLEFREVGAWGPHAYQPRPSESGLRSMREWAEWQDPKPIGRNRDADSEWIPF
jgi:hypothetical protein